jgi:hypothetical protein
VVDTLVPARDAISAVDIATTMPARGFSMICSIFNNCVFLTSFSCMIFHFCVGGRVEFSCPIHSHTTVAQPSVELDCSRAREHQRQPSARIALEHVISCRVRPSKLNGRGLAATAAPHLYSPANLVTVAVGSHCAVVGRQTLSWYFCLKP